MSRNGFHGGKSKSVDVTSREGRVSRNVENDMDIDMAVSRPARDV